MATFTADVLAEGQVPNPQAAIYTATQVSFVKGIVMKNPNAVTQLVQLFVNRAGTARAWKQAQLLQDEFVEFLTGGETLELPVGAKIEAVSTTNVVVDFTITGVTQS